MRHRAQLPAAALACALTLGGCGVGRSGVTASGDPTAGEPTVPTGQDATSPVAAEIPDDFPLSAGMGGPDDTIATSRTGTGLRDLTLCGAAPLRGLATRDRMVADNSGGESADTRELALLGSPDEAAQVAQAFTDLPSGCDTPSLTGSMETLTEVRRSPFGPDPAVVLVQTYTFDGEPAAGATIIHVLPVGAALLVTSTYGQWRDAALMRAIAGTEQAARDTVAALLMFDDQAPSGAASPRPTGSAATVPDQGIGRSVVRHSRVGSAGVTLTTYGEGSLASLDEQADVVTTTAGTSPGAMSVITKTGS